MTYELFTVCEIGRIGSAAPSLRFVTKIAADLLLPVPVMALSYNSLPTLAKVKWERHKK